MSKFTIALDSARSKDDNGFLHVAISHITKATVNPYYGYEIPDWQKLGLDPNRIYYALRDPQELEKSLSTWRGLPLHLEHHTDHAEDPQKLTRVGTVGTDVKWNEPYIDAPLTIWDQDAIDKIENGSYKELSCAYRYDPDFSQYGTYNGEHYDFVMRNIRGNHVALVEEGRAGPDVVVSDSKINSFKTWRNKMALKLRNPFKGARDNETVKTEEENIVKTEDTPVMDDDMLEELKVKYNLDDEALKDIIEKIVARHHAADEDKTVEDEATENKDETKTTVEDEEQTVEDEDEQAKDESESAKDSDEAILEALKTAGLESASDEIKQAFIAGMKANGMASDKDDVEEEIVTKEDLKTAEDRAIKRMSAIYKAKTAAVNKVAPLVGRIDPMAFDSAKQIYAYALRKQGIPLGNNPTNAYESMVDTLLFSKHGSTKPYIAQDNKPKSYNFESRLKNNVRIDE